MSTGKNKLLMAPLRSALEEAGFKDVQTYIQSGNVIASTALSSSEAEALIHNVIASKFGGDIEVIAKTPNEIEMILAINPFGTENTDKLYFTLLKSLPLKQKIDSFFAVDYSPDNVILNDKVIYTLYASRYSDSKINNNYFERKLKVVATTRNYNTMVKLRDMGLARDVK